MTDSTHVLYEIIIKPHTEYKTDEIDKDMLE